MDAVETFPLSRTTRLGYALVLATGVIVAVPWVAGALVGLDALLGVDRLERWRGIVVIAVVVNLFFGVMLVGTVRIPVVLGGRRDLFAGAADRPGVRPDDAQVRRYLADEHPATGVLEMAAVAAWLGSAIALFVVPFVWTTDAEVWERVVFTAAPVVLGAAGWKAGRSRRRVTAVGEQHRRRRDETWALPPDMRDRLRELWLSDGGSGGDGGSIT